MAKSSNIVTGVDVGQYAVKAVSLQRRAGGQLSLLGYSVRVIGDRERTDAEIASEIRAGIKEANGGKHINVAVTSSEGIVRIIEQPATSPSVLRQALKLNASQMLHQDCPDFLFDCDKLKNLGEEKEGGQERFLVAGLPRQRITRYYESLNKVKVFPQSLQFSSTSLFNAFEKARPQVFEQEAFILLDIGHKQSVVIGGKDGALTMIRTIDFGGEQIVEELTGNGAIDRESAILLAEQGDAGMAQAAHDSFVLLSREMINSIGFFEGQWEKTIKRVFVSGGPSRTEMLMQTLSDELNLPCEVWDPLDVCDLYISTKKKAKLELEARNLNVAFGAAIELLD